MNSPAVSRYGATAPELLRWFDRYNANWPYRDQVKPFGFLLSLHAKRDWKGEEVIEPQSRRGRPAKFEPPKPVAPFDRDPNKIAASAFDRTNGRSVPAHALQTYAEALAQYHLHPESKCLGGNYCDRGTTQRRHIRVSGISHIGKEANELDRHQVLGIDANARPDYGLADDSLARFKSTLNWLVATMGTVEAARALGIPPRRLRAIVTGNATTSAGTALRFAGRLTVAINQAEALRAEQRQKFQEISRMIQALGLRETARQFRVDPSNLRKSINKMNVH